MDHHAQRRCDGRVVTVDLGQWSLRSPWAVQYRVYTGLIVRFETAEIMFPGCL
jgi:hypothetical protein